MKTQAMDKANRAGADCIYPFATTPPGRYPSTRHFQVVHDQNGRATGIQSRIRFDSRTRIANVSGYATRERRPNTFQISSHIYLFDCWFCGLLNHSCDPNVLLDTDFLELWSLYPILAGALLTIDHAVTADILPYQFACNCGKPRCRGWIKGRQEQINAEGLRFLEQWHNRVGC
ncbi:SET domain-containing protein-lysine N-methyltransferase [Pseudomonas sp. B22129]|uniref:SET domain-containing protein-lysine N-methyltransferase n=1 Tax=Pseudomonas sp. B22129 TaxID=3235111 RepID=UPI0037833C94